MKIDGKEYPGIIVEKLKSLDPRLGFSSIINKLEQYGSGNTILHKNFP
jgi:hypothetical protein